MNVINTKTYFFIHSHSHSIGCGPEAYDDMFRHVQFYSLAWSEQTTTGACKQTKILQKADTFVRHYGQ